MSSPWMLLGAPVARRIEEEARLTMTRPAHLVALLDPGATSAVAYAAAQRRVCERVGVRFTVLETSGHDALRVVHELNDDSGVTGVFVHMPIHDAQELRAAVAPSKDVEGGGPSHVGALATRRRGIVACTPQAVLELLASADAPLRGAHVVVVGNSATVGLPLSLLLCDADATVTVCHAATRDLASHTRNADVLVVAAGRPGLIDGSMVKKGSVVVDVGTTVVGGRIVGDVDQESVGRVCSAITPVPGGVGPVTVACLMRNLARL